MHRTSTTPAIHQHPDDLRPRSHAPAGSGVLPAHSAEGLRGPQLLVNPYGALEP